MLDADAAAHEVLAEDQVLDELAATFGDCILGPDGKVDRKELADLVFGDSEGTQQNRKQLEALVHPRTHAKLLKMREVATERGKSVFVLDVPLLLEAAWQEDCDLLLFLDTPAQVRRERAAERGWSAAEFAQRERAQLPISKKRSAADLILESGGSIDKLRQQVKAAWDRHVV